MTTPALPAGAGVGFKHDHFESVRAWRADGAAGRDGEPSDAPWPLWFEVHSENYLQPGGPRLQQLAELRRDHPLSFHGVGGSLGGDPCELSHLRALARLIARFQPALVSEHAVWSRRGSTCFADLLPLPRTVEAQRRLIDGIDRYQNAIGRRILIENPTNYLPFVSEMDEPQFLVESARAAGCGLLLDVNNLYLSANNCGIDADAYLRALPPALVGEIHIAGHDADPRYGPRLLIDSHAADVAEPVWSLLELALRHLGPKPVLLERDADLPPFRRLLDERDRAAALLAAQPWATPRTEGAHDVV